MTTSERAEGAKPARTGGGSRPLRIVQVGPRRASPDSRGGIATVMSLILDYPGDDADLQHVVTYGDGSAAHKVRVAATGMARLAALVATRRVDVVHAHMSFKGSVVRKALALRLAQAAGVPTVLHAHSHGFTRWFRGLPRYQRVAVQTLLHADRWLVLGDRWAQEYAQHLRIDPQRVSVLHNPTVPPALPDGQTWQWPHSGDEPIVRMVFLGRLGQRKGCYDLIAALARLDDATRARIHLVMAGDGDLHEVRAAARASDLEDTVEFPGWIDESTRAALLATADVLLLPSHQEGLPMAVLEGMSAGLAILTTPVGGIPEVIEDDVNGLLVTPGDDKEIAAALARLVAEPGLRSRLSQAARATSLDYDVTRWYASLSRIWADEAGRGMQR